MPTIDEQRRDDRGNRSARHVRPVSEEAYRDRLRAQGLDDDAVAVASAGLSAIRTSSEAPTTDGVRRVLGRDPACFEDYVRRAADPWR